MSVWLTYKSASKSNEKLVNQKYSTLFLSRMLEVEPSSDWMEEYEKIVPFSFLVNM